MDTNKNSYTIIYTIVLVAVVATILALVSIGLKNRQQTNIDVEKQSNILGCAGLAQDAKNASDKNAYIQEEFKKYITEALVVNADGEIIVREDISKTDKINQCAAFKIKPKEQFDIIKKIEAASEADKKALKDKLQLPVFVCNTPNGGVNYIISGYGAGLWGPIWTYMAIKEDGAGIAGALFDHEGETPGLGGDIVTEKFRSQFTDKIFIENGSMVPVRIVKGGAKDKAHEVDALSGATITSKAVETMVNSWLAYYQPFLQKNAKNK